MIYFDNAASTKVDSEFLNFYCEYTKNNFANPNSQHFLGMKINNDIDKARDSILKSLKLNRDYEVIFVSSATEANNLAIKGYCLRNINRGKHILTTKIQHASVLEVYEDLAKNHGFIVDYLNFNEDGTFDIEDIKSKITNQTILISLTPVNNEVGLIEEVEKVKNIAKNFPKVALHLDCAQTLGKINFDYTQGDMLTFSSHKIHGLKSIACLIKKKKILLNPLTLGGGQEANYRSGTQDAGLIVSFAMAIDKIIGNFNKNPAKLKYFFKFLVEELSKNDEIILHLYKNQCPNILNFSLKNKKASVVVEALSNKEIYVSSVSACSSKKEEPSYVLLALGKDLNEAKNPIRLSFSNDNTIEEAQEFIKILNEILKEVKSRNEF